MDDIKEKSEYIRKNRNVSILIFITFPFVGFISAWAFSLIGCPEQYSLIIAVPYAVLFLVVGVRWSYSYCPACNAPMFRKGLFFYGFFRCVHYGYNLKDITTSKIK